MVDSVKNYGIAGVSANVQLGKSGVKVVGSNSDQVSFVNTSDELVNANLADTQFSNIFTLVDVGAQNLTVDALVTALRRVLFTLAP